MKVEDTLTMKHFPLVVQTDCRNMDRIYPLKQRQVSDIIQIAKSFPVIKKVIVFGSSITPKCHIGSDLDLCVEADTDDGMTIFELQKKIGEVCNWNCDIVMYANLGERLKKIIQSEGVVVYE